MLVSRDLNLDLRGPEFIPFMCVKLGLELSNNLEISTSRNSTCNDIVFSCHIKQLETPKYILYFSTYRRLLSKTSHSTNLKPINDAMYPLFGNHSL